MTKFGAKKLKSNYHHHHHHHHHHHQIFIISCQTVTKYNKTANNITVRLVHICKNHSVYKV